MLGYLAPSFGVSSSSDEAGDRGVSKDLLVAEIIQSEADEGNPFAQELVRDGRTFLGVASVHTARATRLRKGAMRASRMGYHGLARMGMQAARAEDHEATAYAAQLASAVRRSHMGVFGYITPEEERQQRRNMFLEGLSNEQREGVMNELLDRVLQTSVNYGVDDLFAEEVDDEAVSEIYAAATCYGADMDAVFGAGAFKNTLTALRPALAKLQKRVEAIEARIARLEGSASGDEVEDTAVESLKRKKALTKAKLAKVEEATEAVEEAEEASDAMGAVEAAALLDDPNADLPGVDDALAMGADLFGLSEKREAAISKRIERLEAKADALEDKGASEKKIAAIRKRIERLQAKIEEADEGGASEDSQPDTLVTKQPKAYSKDEFLSSFFGAENTPRRAFVGYFTRRAESMGLDVAGMHEAFGAAESEEARRTITDFLEDVGLSASTAFNPEMRGKIRAAREAARKAFAVESKRVAAAKARRSYLDALENSRDYVRKMGRYLRGRGEQPVLPTAKKGKTLRIGSRGDAVKELQRNLLELNMYASGKPSEEDGKFGKRTYAAVKKFQSSVGIKVDGIYGPQTQEAMAKALAPATTPRRRRAST